MSTVVQQLLTLTGVVLGAGATYTVTALTERAKWRRSLDTRWDDKRLAAYTEYANGLKKSLEVSYRLAATHGYPASTQPIDLDTGLQALAVAEADRTAKWETVLLLGSPEAIAAARRWHKAAWMLRYVARGETTIEHDEYVRLYESMGRLRDEFYEAARADLGIKSGALPVGEGAWLPPGYRPRQRDDETPEQSVLGRAQLDTGDVLGVGPPQSDSLV